jgi:hypothetical protein
MNRKTVLIGLQGTLFAALEHDLLSLTCRSLRLFQLGTALLFTLTHGVSIYHEWSELRHGCGTEGCQSRPTPDTKTPPRKPSKQAHLRGHLSHVWMPQDLFVPQLSPCHTRATDLSKRPHPPLRQRLLQISAKIFTFVIWGPINRQTASRTKIL